MSTYLQILIICSANSLFNRVNPEPARHQLRFRRWQAGRLRLSRPDPERGGAGEAGGRSPAGAGQAGGLRLGYGCPMKSYHGNVIELLSVVHVNEQIGFDALQ